MEIAIKAQYTHSSSMEKPFSKFPALNTILSPIFTGFSLRKTKEEKITKLIKKKKKMPRERKKKKKT